MKGFMEYSFQAAPCVLDTLGRVYSTGCFTIRGNTEAVNVAFYQVLLSPERVAFQRGLHVYKHFETGISATLF